MNACSSSLGTMSVMMTPRQGEAGDGSTGVFERQLVLGARALRYATSFGNRCVAERRVPPNQVTDRLLLARNQSGKSGLPPLDMSTRRAASEVSMAHPLRRFLCVESRRTSRQRISRALSEDPDGR